MSPRDPARTLTRVGAKPDCYPNVARLLPVRHDCATPIGKTAGVMLLRVQLPDRPGSLGAVATAMGSAGADILAIEIVERGPDAVIDDFMVNLAPGMMPDTLVTACASVQGCQVLYVSRHQETWGIESDIEALNRMTADPDHASEILLESAPTVFRSQWAALVRGDGSAAVLSTELAPDFDAASLTPLAPFTTAHRLDLPTGWLPSWPATTVAVAPMPGDLAIIVGRNGGPEFLDSELHRLVHLATLAALPVPR